MLDCNDWSDLRACCADNVSAMWPGIKTMTPWFSDCIAAAVLATWEPNSTWLSIQFDLCHILYFILCLSLSKYWTDSWCFSHLPIDHVSLYSEIVSFIVFFQSSSSSSLLLYYSNLFCCGWHPSWPRPIITKVAMNKHKLRWRRQDELKIQWFYLIFIWSTYKSNSKFLDF